MRSLPGRCSMASANDVEGRAPSYGAPESGPMIASRRAALSRTVRDTTPWVTIPNIISPVCGPDGPRPRLVLRPTRPLQAAGMRTEPPPSLAPAAGTMPAATAAPEPPEEPPGVWPTFHGLRAGPHSSGSVTAFAPNSGVLVLPKITSPASRKRWVTSACWSATSSLSAREPHDVGNPAYSWARSLTRNGTPANGPDRPGSAACASATPVSGITTALSCGLTASWRSRARASRSAAVTSFSATRRARVVASQVRYSLRSIAGF